MLTFEDIKRKSRKTLQKMVLSMSGAVSEETPAPVAVENWKEIPSRYEVVDKMIVTKTSDGVEVSLTLNLDEETYLYLKTVCEGRGESFSACIAQNITFSRENGFL